MTVTEQAQVDQIERDRKRREEELLLLLLLLFNRGINHAAYAIRTGGDPVSAAADVILGSPALGYPGGAGPASRIMAASHVDGMRRAFRMAGEKSPPPEEFTPGVLPVYRDKAQNMLNGMAETLGGKIEEGVADAAAEGKDAGEIATTVRGELKGGGYGYGINPSGEATDPYILETVTELSIVNAHGSGMWEGWGMPIVADKLLGFVHRSVVDDGTTDICLCREGFSSPKDDEYWLHNWPSLHWGCRSCILPVFKPREWSAAYPKVPPAPGFGTAPFYLGRLWEAA